MNPNFTNHDFTFLLVLLRNINPNIGDYETHVYMPEDTTTFSVKLSNGRIIIPIEIMQDMYSMQRNDTRLAYIANNFVTDKVEQPIKQAENSTPIIPLRNTSKAESKKKKSPTIILTFTSIILIFIIYFIFFNSSNYQKGDKLLRNGKYDEALVEFKKVDSSNDDYKKSVSKINYINGFISYNKNNYEEALNSFSQVDLNDDYFPQTKNLIDKIESNPDIIYNRGVKLIKDEKFDSAVEQLSKIKSSDAIFAKANQKLMLATGLKYYAEKDYEQAHGYLDSYTTDDEFYQKAKDKLALIDKEWDVSYNKSYVQSLISYATKFQQEFNLSQNYSVYDVKMISLRNFTNLKSDLMSLTNYAKNKDPLISNLKSLIVQWMNSFINRVNTYLHYWSLAGGEPVLMELYYSSKKNDYIAEENNLAEKINKEEKTLKEKYNIED